MRKAATHFEQIPVRKVKDMIATLSQNESVNVKATLHSTRPILQCRICSEPIPIETAKTDGDGQAIHEECYILSLTKKSLTKKNLTPGMDSARTRRMQLPS
jgi:hypothetical protein